jgi:iron(III) transport system ATP-binding protein
VLGDLPVAGDPPDGEAEVLVRPEQVRVDDLSAGATTKARVEEVSFYGHDAAVRLTLLPGGPVLVARLPGLDAPEVGRTVTVGVAGQVVAFR